MNKEEQLNSDKKVLASLEAEYKRAQRVIYSIRALVTDLNFEELIPDSQERCLMVDELQAYDYIRTNLMNRIRFYRARVKKEESIKDWSQYKKTDSAYISVDVSNEGDHGACTQVCGDDMFQTQHDPNLDDVDPEQKAMAMNHCGQDATCQVDDGSAAVEKPIITSESLKQLMDYQVIGVCEPGFPCEGCVQDHYNTPCVKVELVGGYMLCLAPLPNSIITE